MVMFQNVFWSNTFSPEYNPFFPTPNFWTAVHVLFTHKNKSHVNDLICVCKGGRAQREQRQAEEKLRPYLGRVDPGETVFLIKLEKKKNLMTGFVHYIFVIKSLYSSFYY